MLFHSRYHQGGSSHEMAAKINIAKSIKGVEMHQELEKIQSEGVVLGCVDISA
jgi:hypothetical protein